MIQSRAPAAPGLFTFLLLTALVIPPSARAAFDDPLYLSATNKLDYRRLSQESAREEAFRNRLEVRAMQGPFSLWVRLESLQLSNATVYDPYGAGEEDILDDQPIDETTISRRTFTVDQGGLQLQVGDFSSVFGRGLALSVFEEEELNFDTRLEGMIGSGTHLRGSAVALAGSDRGNRFRGIFLEPAPLGFLRLGGSFVEAWGGEGAVRPRETHIGGLAELTIGPAVVYGEYLHREFPGLNGEGFDFEDGYGGFASAVVTLAGVTVSGEYRDYFKFEHDYHDPPTTIRQHTWTLLNRHNGQILTDIPNADVRGGLASAEYAFDYFTTVLVSYSRQDQPHGDLNNDYWETYGEAKGTLKEKVFLTVAAAESELNFQTEFDERLSAFGEIVLHLTDLHSLTVGTEWSEVRKVDSATSMYEFPEEYRERIFSASYGLSPWLNLTATYEDTTEEDPTEPNDQWLSFLAEITVNENHVVQASAGSERGGWKCNGGVCFFEPEFEGFKIRWVARY